MAAAARTPDTIASKELPPAPILLHTSNRTHLVCYYTRNFFILQFSQINGKMGHHAGMTELADVQDLGSCGEIRVGSTPTTRTIIGHQSYCTA